ncbi:hypothetical protein ACN38_g5453 [Penicillium nordicum]|uniref:Uncharacterized protein n=1 Tax=Penicillium nordicum TaxID=229535 RepID=A0A0M8P8U3_9EURO|nr:hypothetical protein ACN38_g5453 [Penicillium nordicum]
MSHSVLTPGVYYTYCTVVQVARSSSHTLHIHTLSLGSLSSPLPSTPLTVANLSTRPLAPTRRGSSVQVTPIIFQQVRNRLISPPIASILAPPRYPSPKHGKEKKDKIPTISCLSPAKKTIKVTQHLKVLSLGFSWSLYLFFYTILFYSILFVLSFSFFSFLSFSFLSEYLRDFWIFFIETPVASGYLTYSSFKGDCN